ncbi:Uncharacterised protein [Enterobacter kobei]|nr:Uncharacterised protein [Enterobacter kobei]
MSDTTNPLTNPEQAAHEIVLEMVRAGKVTYARTAAENFTELLNHFIAESTRIQEQNTKQ